MTSCTYVHLCARVGAGARGCVCARDPQPTELRATLTTQAAHLHHVLVSVLVNHEGCASSSDEGAKTGLEVPQPADSAHQAIQQPQLADARRGLEQRRQALVQQCCHVRREQLLVHSSYQRL